MATSTKARQKTAVDGGKDLRRSIIENLENIEKSRYDVAVELSVIYEGDLFKSWNFEKFDDYCEQELGMGRERYWFVQMGQTIRQHNITKEKIGDMGWTKFKELVSIINEKTSSKKIDAYLKKAQDMTFEETREFVRRERNIIEKTPGQKQKKVNLSFTLINDQADTVETALSTAMEMAGLDPEDKISMGVALEYIAADFLANRDDSAKHVTAIKKKLHIPKAEAKKAHKKHAHAGKKAEKKAAKGTEKKASAKKTEDELSEL